MQNFIIIKSKTDLLAMQSASEDGLFNSPQGFRKLEESAYAAELLEKNGHIRVVLSEGIFLGFDPYISTHNTQTVEEFLGLEEHRLEDFSELQELSRTCSLSDDDVLRLYNSIMKTEFESLSLSQRIILRNINSPSGISFSILESRFKYISAGDESIFQICDFEIELEHVDITELSLYFHGKPQSYANQIVGIREHPENCFQVLTSFPESHWQSVPPKTLINYGES